MGASNLTERQEKWFASVRAGLERDTGRTMEQWVEIARSCPETAHRARLRWFKDHHGLLQNRASQVLSAAFPSTMGWSDAEELIASVWTNPKARAIFEALDAAASSLPDVTRTARKSYTAWSRRVQFAALRPLRSGDVVLGLALQPDSAPELDASRNESWSERLKARATLAGPGDVNNAVRAWLRAAWERS